MRAVSPRLMPSASAGVGGHALPVVAIGHVDAAVWSDHHVVRLVELPVGVARLAGLAEAHEQLAGGAELVDLVALGAGLVAREIRDPDVAVAVQANAVRRHHHALADVREHLARTAIELEHRIDRVVVAIDGTAARRARAAALVGPDVAVLRIDVDAGAGAPLPARGQLSPILGDIWRRVRQPFTGNEIAGLGLRRYWRVHGVARDPRSQHKYGARAERRDQGSRLGHDTSCKSIKAHIVCSGHASGPISNPRVAAVARPLPRRRAAC